MSDLKFKRGQRVIIKPLGVYGFPGVHGYIAQDRDPRFLEPGENDYPVRYFLPDGKQEFAWVLENDLEAVS